jgi:hypothetical protein
VITWVGCSDDDIHAITQTHGVHRLPAVYERWLRERGQGPSRGSQFHRQGGTAYFPKALGTPAEAREIVSCLPTDFLLPSSSIVVSTWQAYMFEFVVVTEDDDPALQVFIEGEATARPARGSIRLSDWLRYLIKQEERDS